MKFRNLILAGISVLALGGCVSNTSHTGATSDATPADTGNIAQRAGLDAAAASKEVDRQGFNSLVDAGVGASMARNLGGAGIGLGVLGWLAGSSSTGWTDPAVLAELPSGANIAAYEKRYSEALFKASGDNPEADGYSRVNDPYDSAAVTFIKPGCAVTRGGYYNRKCSQRYGVKLAQAKSGGVYVLRLSTSTNLDQIESLYRKIVNQRPNELALYLPPRKISGQVTPARLYQKGKEINL